MCKIGILLLDRDFEHDIYELIKAFYPEGDIHSLYEKDEAVYDIFFTVKKENDNFVIKYETKDQKGVASAEVIRGADGDSSQETHEKLMDAHELRKANKDSLKYALYNVLVKLTGRTLPWGNLTGIRPAKLAMGMIESGMKNTDCRVLPTSASQHSRLRRCSHTRSWGKSPVESAYFCQSTDRCYFR